jgi:DUF2971 family protein
LKILESQRFWATAHDCTNDKGELVSANTAIFEVAQAHCKDATGLPARVLNLFLNNYETEMIAKVRTAYLCCFSVARDDENQWRRYGQIGKGVCLGLRVINEAAPQAREVFSRLFEVIYSEDALRQWFSDTLGKICSALNRFPPSDQNVKFSLATVRGIAAFASITTKTSDWSSEQEVRHVTMDNLEPGVKPSVRIGADGKEVRYLPISLRAEGKLIALDEIIVGAEQNLDEVRTRFAMTLKSKGYVEGSIEYPRFTQSNRA